MQEQDIVLCVGEDDGLMNLRKLVLETIGVRVIFARSLQAACQAATSQRLCAAIISAEFSLEEQVRICDALSALQQDLPLLRLQGITTPWILIGFIEELRKRPVR